MKLRSIKRGIGDGVRSVFRNGMMTFASIATITVCLIVLGITFCLVWNVQAITAQMDDNLSIVVFMKEGITKAETNNLLYKLDKRPEVASYTYISADDAWEQFQKELLGGGDVDPELLEYVDENPLKDSANIEIILSSASAQQSLTEYLESLPQVRKINGSSETAKVLASASRLIGIVGLALILLLIVVSILLISNTVRLSVYVRREEISIMKYMGASNSFVRLPFVVEGIVIGLLGAVIPCLVIYFGYDRLLKVLTDRFGEITTLVSFVPVNDIIKILFPLYAVLSIVVGTWGAVSYMNKYLRA